MVPSLLPRDERRVLLEGKDLLVDLYSSGQHEEVPQSFIRSWSRTAESVEVVRFEVFLARPAGRRPRGERGCRVGGKDGWTDG